MLIVISVCFLYSILTFSEFFLSALVHESSCSHGDILATTRVLQSELQYQNNNLIKIFIIMNFVKLVNYSITNFECICI